MKIVLMYETNAIKLKVPDECPTGSLEELDTWMFENEGKYEELKRERQDADIVDVEEVENG